MVRLNYYTTDVDAFMAATPQFVERLHDANCKPGSDIVEGGGLVDPDFMVELEATAVA